MDEEQAGARPRRRRVATTSTPPAAVRLARLVRSVTPITERTSAASDGGLVIELGDARLTVGRGADVAMVVTVLALLRGGDR